MSTWRIELRCAATAFSLSPPIGSTRPRSVISPVIATSPRTGMPVSALTIAVAIAMPADGPSFGVRAGRNVHVQIALAMKLAIDAEHAGARARVAQRRARRLLHHVAERAGELQLAASADDAHLDLEHVAADARVREPRRDADLVLEGQRRRIVTAACRAAP